MPAFNRFCIYSDRCGVIRYGRVKGDFTSVINGDNGNGMQPGDVEVTAGVEVVPVIARGTEVDVYIAGVCVVNGVVACVGRIPSESVGPFCADYLQFGPDSEINVLQPVLRSVLCFAVDAEFVLFHYCPVGHGADKVVGDLNGLDLRFKRFICERCGIDRSVARLSASRGDGFGHGESLIVNALESCRALPVVSILDPFIGQFPAMELCRVGRVAGNGNDLGSPAEEGVGVFLCRFLCRSLAVVSRHLAVGYFAALQFCTIVINELDHVLVDGLGIGRGVSRVSGDRNELGIPTCEGVGVLCGRSLGRIGMSGYRAVCDSGRVDHGIIIVLPGYGVFVDRRSVGRCVGRVAGDGNDLRIPARKCVGVLCSSLFGRIRVSGYSAVCDCGRVDHGAVVVLPGDGVFVDRRSVGRNVLGVAGDCNDFRSPSGESVCVLRISCLARVCVEGNRAICDRGGVDHSAVVVLPGDGVFVDRHGVGRGVLSISGDLNDIGSPAGEGVGVLCVSCL